MTTLDVTTFGAKADGSDATSAIQAALNSAAAGDTVWVPPAGTFMINPLVSLKPKSNTTFRADGTLMAYKDHEIVSQLILADGLNGFTATGTGKLVGNRDSADAAIPEQTHGHGIRAVNCSNLTITGLTAAVCKGDGFYFENCTDALLEDAVSTGNKRNAASIICGTRILVTRSTFAWTDGPSPMPCAGIDIEPDHQTQELLDIRITNNTFTGNKGCGVYCAFDENEVHRRIYVVNNIMDQHYKSGGPPIRGKNDQLGWALYSACRWIPGYDWWCFPKEYTRS